MTVAIGIDPRIRARRIAVRRAEGRRRLRFLVGALGVVLLAVTAWLVSRSPLLDLDHVEIDGVASARVAEVEETLALERGTPLVDLDQTALRVDLEALPWVETAAVSRKWPGTLTIHVVPRVPVATLGVIGGGSVLVDAGGVVIGDATDHAGTLVAVAVETSALPGEVDPAALPGLALAVALPSDLLAWVEAVTIEPRTGAGGHAEVGLDLIGDATVRLGPVEHLDDKVAAIRAVLGAAELDCLRVIDVTVADLNVVRRDPVCDGTAATPGDSGG